MSALGAVAACWLAGPGVAAAQSPVFTPIAGSPFNLGLGNDAQSVAFSPDGKLLAVATAYTDYPGDADDANPTQVVVFAGGRTAR